SSEEHPWFVESRASRSSSKRDWYYWRDPKPDGSPPNNWRAIFGGPAWEWDEPTGQYYLHTFLKEQPDLNWRNPEVVAAMHGVLRFWFERGIDGFRVDALHMLIKHPDLPDNPVNERWDEGDRDANRVVRKYSQNWPDLFDAVSDMSEVFDEFPGTMAVGEVVGRPETLARYVDNNGRPGLHLAFNFQFIGEDGRPSAWTPERFREILAAYNVALPPGAQPCYAFGNHDRSRFISRHNADGRGFERARGAALLLLGLRGTPFLYYGEEIGMSDVAIPADQLQDPARFLWEGRDPERTPMQWDASPGRGFTSGTPWLPFGPATINAEAQSGDPDSLLSLYRRAIRIRKREPALHAGEELVLGQGPDVFVSLRRAPDGREVLIAVNTATAPRPLPVPVSGGEVLIATDRRLDGVRIHGAFTLPALVAVWIGL
ncbi:MAG: alpha-amylase family glycosyl hydrolase, partial [Dehalococcoidia bacterium]